MLQVVEAIAKKRLSLKSFADEHWFQCRETEDDAAGEPAR
jgi:hypothetical protein